ncbi:Kinesin-like protein [Giardia duodenalis]|uniref:Kinesin-like protein n=1 Tax=Giardia intestinalis TaxID=5741 RepID=V6TZU3_GIAIN|nr:Kinesin-like protein [Giardia intestinalis]
MPVTGVKVAVRVRPFNAREKKEAAKLCVDMPGGGKVVLRDAGAKKPETAFVYDYAYWSHDESRPRATQDTVYADVGPSVLDNAFEGYNYTLFAYGQTGSGKSYSMMGTPASEAEAGIIPRVGRELFRRAAASDAETQVSVSFLEIYNERLRDLLVPAAGAKELKIRQDPTAGVFVQNLSHHAVADYDAIQRLIELGDKNRTVAATNMNATSSRSHSVFAIEVVQTAVLRNDAGEEVGRHVKRASVSLVDLAGSERQGKTGATGDRLTEGININKSLTTLGRVIEALAYNTTAEGRRKPQHVPYRDSQLTYLLQPALGGNSMTCMIAAISPASTNYDESLSTLRYADRAHQIENTVTKNESAQEKYIRELEDRVKELEGLLAAGAGGTGADTDASSTNASQMQDVLEEYKRMLEEASIDSAKRLEEAEKENKALEESLNQFGLLVGPPAYSYLLSLNEDPLFSGLLRYKIVGKETDKSPYVAVFGTQETENPKFDDSIVLANKLGLEFEHFTITYTADDNKYVLACLSETEPVIVNGDYQLHDMEPITLFHGDFIKCGDGNGSYYVFVDPKQQEANPLQIPLLYDEAVSQFVSKNGTVNPLNKLPDQYMEENHDSPHDQPVQDEQISPPATSIDTERDKQRLKEKEKYMQIRDEMLDLFPKLCEASQLARYFGKKIEYSMDYATTIEQTRSGFPSMNYDVSVQVSVQVYNPGFEEYTNDVHTWSVTKFLRKYSALRALFSHAVEINNKDKALEDMEREIASNPCLGLEHPFAMDESVLPEYDEWTHFIGELQLNVADLCKTHTISRRRLPIINPATHEAISDVELEVCIPNPCKHDGYECEAFADRALRVGEPCSLSIYIHRLYGVKPLYNANVHAVVHKPAYLGMPNSNRPHQMMTPQEEDRYRNFILSTNRAVASSCSPEISINPHVRSWVTLDLPPISKEGYDYFSSGKPLYISFYGYYTQVKKQIQNSAIYNTKENTLHIHKRNIIATKIGPVTTEIRDGKEIKTKSEFYFIDINGSGGGE